jgi:signal transduction histidine kinase
LVGHFRLIGEGAVVAHAGRSHPLLGVAAALVPVAVAVATLPLVGAEPFGRHLHLLIAIVLPFAFVGGLLVSRGAGGPMGGLLVIVATLVAVSEASSRYATWGLPRDAPLWREGAWLADLLWFVPLLLFVVFLLLLFPTGQPPTPRWRWVGWLGGVGLGTILVALGVGSWAGRGSTFGPEPSEPLPLLAAVPAGIGAVMCVIAAVSALAATTVRFHRSSGTERQQLRWFVASAVAAAGGLLLLLLVPWGWMAVTFTFPLVPGAIGVAVLRHRLYELPRLMAHAIALAVLVALVMVVHGIIVAVFGPSALALFIVALTVVIAVGSRRIHRLLLAVARRLLPGHVDPYGAIVRLGWQLEAAGDPDEVLGETVLWLAAVLHVDGVLVELPDGTIVASVGVVDPSDELRMPLIHGGMPAGIFRAARRPDDDPFTRRDHRLLEGLAPHLAVAVSSLSLRREVERSHAELITAREEERRRIRRDLHDQLGPTLAAIALGLEALWETLPQQDPHRDDLVGPLREAASSAVGDVRRIVDNLRPPALDELGLPAAIRQAAEQLVERSGTTVSYTLPKAVPHLPAAVEVAVFRIAMEALANVARHAAATHCTVRVDAGTTVELEVRDDGCGIADAGEALLPPRRPAAIWESGSGTLPAVHSPPHASRHGAGLRTMHERATELGGTLDVTTGTPGGTRIVACIPVVRP